LFVHAKVTVGEKDLFSNNVGFRASKEYAFTIAYKNKLKKQRINLEEFSFNHHWKSDSSSWGPSWIETTVHSTLTIKEKDAPRFGL